MTQASQGQHLSHSGVKPNRAELTGDKELTVRQFVWSALKVTIPTAEVKAGYCRD